MKDYIVITTISVLASFVHCILGFGDAMLAMPFLLMFYKLQVADTIANNYAFIIGIVLTGYSFKHLKEYKWESALLFIAYTLLTIIGMLVLKTINENALVAMLSIVLIFYPLIIFLANRRHSFVLNRYFSIIFGAISGFLGATTTINGPPLVIYGQLRKFNKDVFVAMLQPVFLWGSIINFYGYYQLGLFNLRLTAIMFASTPLVILNAYFCRKIRNKINHKVFAYLVVAMIFASGVMMFTHHINDIFPPYFEHYIEKLL